MGDVFPAGIGGADDLAGANAAARKEDRVRSRPVVAAWLHSAGRGACHASAAAGYVADAWRAPELTCHDN